jgi:hypothetical protein
MWGGANVRHSDPKSADLLAIMEDFNLDSTLPPGTITYEEKTSRTTIDLCLVTLGLVDRVIRSQVNRDLDHDSDHLPISTVIDMRVQQLETLPKRDWKRLDEGACHKALRRALPPLRRPANKTALDTYVQEVVKAIQKTIDQAIAYTRPSNYIREGWSEECRAVLDNYTAPKSYRPIALMNTTGKIMDAVMARQLSYLAETHHVLPPTHMGGRKMRSTEHALHAVTYKIYETWTQANGQVASLLLLDVSEAFDNVSHTRLLHDLRKRRVDEKIVKWMASFLSNRHTSIAIDGFRSTAYQINTGIPQGVENVILKSIFLTYRLLGTCIHVSRFSLHRQTNLRLHCGVSAYQADTPLRHVLFRNNSGIAPVTYPLPLLQCRPNRGMQQHTGSHVYGLHR